MMAKSVALAVLVLAAMVWNGAAFGVYDEEAGTLTLPLRRRHKTAEQVCAIHLVSNAKLCCAHTHIHTGGVQHQAMAEWRANVAPQYREGPPIDGTLPVILQRNFEDR